MSSDLGQRRIPFYDYGALARDRGEEVTKAIESVIRRGAFIMQAEVSMFEEQLASYLGAGEVIGVGNCTDGLELILRAIGVGAGDEVILPAHTFVATAGAVRSCGATPRFAEVGPGRDLDPNDLDRVSSSATRAVIPVSLNGRCARLDEIVTVADERGWIVVEDAAQAVGARLGGRAAGTFGRAGAFSFYPAKTLGAVGDAGAVVTTDPSLADRLRLMRDHGRTESGDVAMWGRNTRLDNLQAAVLLVQLAHYEVDIARRRSIFSAYLDGLSDTASMLLPTLDEGGRQDICQNFEIEVADRDRFRAAMADLGIGTAMPWGGKAVTDFSALENQDATPTTSGLLSRLVLLPLHQYMSDEDVATVIEAARSVQG